MNLENLIFVDEGGFWAGMTRRVGRAKKGRKVYQLQKCYCGKNMTMIGAIKRTGVVATKVLEGSMKKGDFLDFIKVDLVPKLQPGDVVVMDNLNSYRCQEVREMIGAVGARVEYLPVYSPEFNPIEMMWSQLKSLVSKFRTETIE